MAPSSNVLLDEYLDPLLEENPLRQKYAQQALRVRERNTQVFQALVRSVLDHHRGRVSEQEIPYKVFEGLLAELAVAGRKLDLSVYPPRERGYAKYIVYNHKDNGAYPFSFTLIVLNPGQKTPKHSHRVDCAPICVKGRIDETVYADIGTGELQVLRKSVYEPYNGGYLLQYQPNIHHLENCGSEVAMSLHLYVFDADPNDKGVVGSSILKVYP